MEYLYQYNFYYYKNTFLVLSEALVPGGPGAPDRVVQQPVHQDVGVAPDRRRKVRVEWHVQRVMVVSN